MPLPDVAEEPGDDCSFSMLEGVLMSHLQQEMWAWDCGPKNLVSSLSHL